MDVAVVVGHNSSYPGSYAINEDGSRGISEYEFNLRLAKQICFVESDTTFTRNLLLRSTKGSIGQQDRAIVQQIRELGPRCVVELHFNYLNPKALPAEKWQYQACTALYDGRQEGSEELGRAVTSPVARLLELSSIKVQHQFKSWSSIGKNSKGNITPMGHQLLVLTETTVPAIILEHHVGNNLSAHLRAEEALANESLARSICIGIDTWLTS